MADISKIQIESGTYNIKDTTARNLGNTLDNHVLTEMVVFGDSWSDPQVTEAVWSSCVAGELSLNLHNYASNGAGFVAPSNNLISTQVTNASNDVNLNKNKVKYVVLFGGINDYRNSITMTNLRTEIVAQYNRCKSIFPNAKVLYVNNFQYPYTSEQSVYWYQLEYTLSSWNVLVLNQDGFLRKDYFLANLYHLTIYGQRLIATNIASALSGGQIKNEGVMIEFSDLSTAHLRLKRQDNMILFSFIASGLTTAPQTITYSQEICWYNTLSERIWAQLQENYMQSVIQFNQTTLLIGRNNTSKEKVRFDGMLPLNTYL